MLMIPNTKRNSFRCISCHSLLCKSTCDCFSLQPHSRNTLTLTLITFYSLHFSCFGLINSSCTHSTSFTITHIPTFGASKITHTLTSFAKHFVHILINGLSTSLSPHLSHISSQLWQSLASHFVGWSIASSLSKQSINHIHR